MVRLLLLIASALLAASPAAARDGQPSQSSSQLLVTGDRITSLGSEGLTRWLFGELSDIMHLDASSFDIVRRTGISPFTNLVFLSRPRVSSREGVCVTDRVLVTFDFSAGGSGVRPRQIAMERQFFVHDLTMAVRNQAAAERRFALDDACEAIDPRQAALIDAATDEMVSSAVGLAAELVEQARQRRAPIPVTCHDEMQGRDLPQAECLVTIARLRPEGPSYIQIIDNCSDVATAIACYRMVFPQRDENVDVRFDFRRGVPGVSRIRVRQEAREF